MDARSLVMRSRSDVPTGGRSRLELRATPADSQQGNRDLGPTTTRIAFCQHPNEQADRASPGPPDRNIQPCRQHPDFSLMRPCPTPVELQEDDPIPYLH